MNILMNFKNGRNLCRVRLTARLIGRNMDDSSVVWKYVRPVDSIRATVAQQRVVPVQHVSSKDLYMSIQHTINNINVNT